MSMKLTADMVREIVTECLYRDDEVTEGEIPEGAILVEGVMNNIGFHPKRIAVNTTAIGMLLAELPKEFQPEPEGGGGWSFLNACMDKHGTQWGEHRDIELLMMLGMASGQAEIMKIPKEILPGGMPYFRVISDG